MIEFLQSLEQSTWATVIRQSLWLYPALEIIHILGIVILVGAAWLFDLRLLGFSKILPIEDLSNYLLPWSRRGLILIVPSGFLLFITNAEALGLDPTFWIKMIVLSMAGLNALAFHQIAHRNRIQVNSESFQNTPFHYKLQALISLLAWIAVITCGRLLAY